jgi:DNA-binding NarL/FixJ family response regulator
MINLMIAEDHAIVREGLKQLFSMTPDISVVAEATSGMEVLTRLREIDIDLLLLDMTMPGISGEDLIARIRSHHQELPILILSMHNEAPIVQRAVKAGACGYLSKDSNPDRLFSAIRKVAGGGYFLDPAIAEQMTFHAPSADSEELHNRLTDREFQVLRLIASGISINDIAAKLSISNKTVSTHKAKLMEKMGFANNASLVRYALMHQLVDL